MDSHSPLAFDGGDGLHRKVAVDLGSGTFGISTINTDTGCAPDCVCGGCLCDSLPEYARCLMAGTLRAFLRQNDPEAFSERELYLVFPYMDFSTRDLGTGWDGPLSSLNCNLPVAGYFIVRNDNGTSNRFDAQTLEDSKAYWFTDSETGQCVLDRVVIRVNGRVTNVNGQVFDNQVLTTVCYYSGNRDCPLGTHVLHGFGNGLVLSCSTLGGSMTITDRDGWTQWVESHITNFQPSTRDDQVCLSENRFIAVKCDDESQEITVALSDRGPVGTTPIFQTERYRLTSILSTETVDTSQWDSGICFPPPLSRHYARCDGASGEIYVNELEIPDGSVTALYETNRYTPTNLWSNQEPTPGVTWSIQECAPVYEEYAKCDDPSFTVLVDTAGRPSDAETALIGSLRFYPTGNIAEGSPFPVVWSTDPCPNTGTSVWQRCRGDGSVLAPFKIRSGSPSVQGANFMYITVTESQPAPNYPNCQIRYSVAYKKVEDDGGAYEIYAGSPSEGPCSNMPDTAQRILCKPLDDAGDPQDPNNPAIRSRLPIADLDGFDPEVERNAARQGGCCGPPST